MRFLSFKKTILIDNKLKDHEEMISKKLKLRLKKFDKSLKRDEDDKD